MSKNFKRLISLILSLVMTISCMTAIYSQEVFADAPTIYIVGDSTGCHYSEDTDANYYYKRVGFGDKIADYLTGGATVENLALSGRSSKSFTTENNYQTLLNNIGEDDILIIAFGHNDEKVETESLGTEPLGDKDTEGSFKHSLYTNYIKVAQDKGAIPILCSPIVRLPKSTDWSDSELHKVNSGDYAACARALASEVGIGFIDLTELTKAQYEEVGFTYAAKYHAAPSENSVDHTHLNNYGAKMVAYLIAANSATTALADYIVTDPVAPTEADLIVNEGYTPPPEGDLDGDDLISSIWSTTSPWYGTAFGNIGGTPAANNNYGITEDGNTVRVKNLNDKGKISTTADGMVLYYQPVSANENFQISADAYVNSITADSTNTGDQVGFGAIMADKILVDTRYDNYNIENYVAASPINLVKGAKGGFAKTTTSTTASDGTVTSTTKITTGPSLSDVPVSGDNVHVSIVKNGTTYTVTYGSCVSTYELTSDQMQGIMYVGLFASRNADITFSNIIYNNEVVEGDTPTTEATTEITTEEATEETTVDSLSGESFIWWAEDNVNSSSTLDVKTYTVNGAAITVNNANSTIGIKGSVTDDDGVSHKAYQIKKNDTTSYGYLSFTPVSDGWATFYMYIPSGKNYSLTNLSDDSSTTVTDMIYTAPVTAGITYQLATTGTNDFGVAGVEFKKKEIVSVSGTLSVNSDDGNIIEEGSTLTFTNDVTGETTVVTLAENSSSYEVELYKGFSYTVTFAGTDTIIINSDDATASINAENAENVLNIEFVDAVEQTVTGTVYGPAGASTTITFGNNEPINVTIGNNGEGTYTTNLKPGKYTVEVGTIEGYTASDLSTSDLTVKYLGTENYKNILYTKPVDAATDYDVYVDRDGTYYDDKTNVYTNLTDAMAAIESSSLTGSANQRFVVHVAPGFYEEQFFVNSDYVSIIADSNDDNIADGNVKVSWYYGIDYMYYSINPSTGFYSKEYAVDKHTKTTCVQKWGSTMIVKGSNFYSEGIVYQNTFNLELRDAELADGVENDMSSGSASNTSYDRTQENADVRLTTATERAAALVIDGQQAEFYNCQFLGSQDTVYTGNYNHYFNDCLIAGETDYIFGNGGTTIFDNCELQWIDYHYEAATDSSVKTKAGYIAVPRGSYIFRNCEITSSGLGLNVTTGNTITTEGYYGRPWGNTASAIFMNCNTNDLILADGWKDMSGVQPSEVAFKEYKNTAADGTLFYSNLTTTSPKAPDGSNRILSDDEAAGLTAGKDWNIYGTWLPISHISYVGNPNIYKFDFTTGNVASPISDESGEAQLTHSGMKYHGTTYGATLSNGSTMTIYAGSDANSMDIAVNSSYSGNAGTLELYKNDEVASCGAIEFDNTVDNEQKTFTVTDINAGDSFTVKYVGSSTFYCGNVTVTSEDGTLTTAPVTNTYEFDFTSVFDGHTQGETATGDVLDKNSVASVALGSNVKYHSENYGFVVSDGAEIEFTVVTAGNTTITIPSSYQNNVGEAGLYKDDILVATTGELNGIEDGTIKAYLEAGTYTIRYSVTGSFYTKGITIVTTGELA